MTWGFAPPTCSRNPMVCGKVNGMKKCKQCGEAKPPEGFYRDKRSEDGRDFYCKACRDGRGAALRAKRRAERPSSPSLTHKQCSRCGETKRVQDFYTGKSQCRSCCTELHREYVNRPEVAPRIKEIEKRRAEKRRVRPPRREPVAPGLEVCTLCNEDKPLDDFYKHKLGRHGRDSACKECRAAINRERRRDPAIREREHRQKVARVFGIPVTQYDEMLGSQSGVCAICGKPQAGKRSRLHVDHDHSTGKVRGLLCNTCNAGLGSFRDDSGLLHAAIKYLESY